MATALKLDSLPDAAFACTHDAFNAYQRDGNSTDDTVTEVGRCPSCEAWLELWTSRTTGEIFNERALDADEIRDLRRSALA